MSAATTTCRVRAAVEADVPAILAIANRAAAETPANFAVRPESLEQWLDAFRRESARYPWLVAAPDEGAVAGFAKASPHRGRCAYDWSAEVTVYLDPAHQRRGLGTALYARLFGLLEAQGYRTLIAGITIPNPASEALHARFGFTRAGVFERIGWKFGRWHDVAYWTRHLGDPSAPPGEIRAVAEVE